MLFCVTYTVFMCWDILGLLLLFSLHSSRGHCSIFPFLSWPSFPLLLLFFSTYQSFPVFLTPIPDFFISTPSLLLFCIPYLSLPHPTVFPCKDVHKEFSSSVNNNLFTSVCLTSSVRVTGHAFVSASKGHETLSHTYSHVHIPWNEKKKQKTSKSTLQLTNSFLCSVSNTHAVTLKTSTHTDTHSGCNYCCEWRMERGEHPTVFWNCPQAGGYKDKCPVGLVMISLVMISIFTSDKKNGWIWYTL